VRTATLLVVLLSSSLIGCDSEPANVTEGGVLTVRSSAFEPGGQIPAKYARRGPGEDVSPPLEWSGTPEGTAEIAVICDDPDAKGFVHWLAYKIAGDARSLDENASGGFVGGKNGFGEIGWSGPRPPTGDGPHHYHFKVYALSGPVEAAAGVTKKELLAAMDGKILAQGEVVGTYERK